MPRETVQKVGGMLRQVAAKQAEIDLLLTQIVEAVERGKSRGLDIELPEDFGDPKPAPTGGITEADVRRVIGSVVGGGFQGLKVTNGKGEAAMIVCTGPSRVEIQ